MIKQYLIGKVYNFILACIQDGLKENQKKESTDIGLALQKNALSDTANYVSEKLQNVSSFLHRDSLIDFALEQSLKSGLFLEFGVYKGESINLIANKISPNPIYGFDSFEGLPEYWRDGFGVGTFKINKLPQVEQNVVLIKGWFNESLPKFLATQKDEVAFLHIDCDLYSSTITIFQCLADSIKPGTVIVFDEYFNYPLWREGEYRAFQEFIASTGLKYEYIGYNRKSEQVAVKII